MLYRENSNALSTFIARMMLVLTAFLACNTAMAAQECKIMVMGDSLSAAYGLPIEKGWVALLEKQLKDPHSVGKFPNCKIVNASVSGETTAGGRTRFPALLERHRPNVVILELGANDGLRGLPIKTMEANLHDMIKMATKANAVTILVGIQIPPNYGPNYTEKFKEAFRHLASKENIPLVPFMLEGFAQDPSAFQADGIHPNAKSQPKILSNIWPYLEPVLLNLEVTAVR